jgi:hypothetical protein
MVQLLFDMLVVEPQVMAVALPQVLEKVHPPPANATEGDRSITHSTVKRQRKGSLRLGIG